MKQEKLGTISLNSKGLRKIADALDNIYTLDQVINMPIWKDNQEGLLFMQIAKGTGEISLVDK